jgi:hypothetical protein
MKAILLIFITLISFNIQAATFGPGFYGSAEPVPLDCHNVTPQGLPPNAWYIADHFFEDSTGMVMPFTEAWFCTRMMKAQAEAGNDPLNFEMRWNFDPDTDLFTLYGYTDGVITSRNFECLIPDVFSNAGVRYELTYLKDKIYKFYVSECQNLGPDFSVCPRPEVDTCAVVRSIPVN